MSSDANWQELRLAAKRAAASAYAPYSGLLVGAAVRTRHGTVYTAGNVENASYGLGNCAERLAVARAVLDNARSQPINDLVEAVVAVEQGGAVLSPCGACRQVILEFGASAEVWLPRGRTTIRRAMSEPFERPPPSNVHQASALGEGAGPESHPQLRQLLELEDEEKVFIMRQLLALRRGAVALYARELNLSETRAMLFVRVDRGLVIAPGFFSNLENPDERTICVQPRHGIVGAAYSLGRANFGVPCHRGDLPGDVLPPVEQQKVTETLQVGRRMATRGVRRCESRWFGLADPGTNARHSRKLSAS